VVIGLPLLDAMLNDSGDALAAGAPLPSRFVLWSFGTGVNQDLFEPRAAPGAQIDTSNPLAPAISHFAGLEGDVTICSGFTLNVTGGADGHHIGRVGRISGTKPFAGSRPTDSHWGGPSIDQLIAGHIGDQTPIASMQLAVSDEGASDGADSGSTEKYLSVKQGSTATSLIGLPNEKNPQRVWETLFGATNAPPHKASVLDFIKNDLQRTAPSLGSNDRARLEAHLDAIRQVELRLAAGCPTTPPTPALDNSEGVGDALVGDVNYLMADLVALAFECDITRVVSVEFTKIAGGVNFWDALGGERVDHHFLSHGSGVLLDKYDLGVDYTMRQLADFIYRLKGFDRARNAIGGASNLLDSTILYATTDVAWGQSHMQERAPQILAGRGMKDGNPYLRAGQHFILPGAVLGATDPRAYSTVTEGSATDVLLTVLRGFDPSANRATPTSVGDVLNTPPPANPQGATGIGLDGLIDPSQA
jgi:hypothetical protein